MKVKRQVFPRRVAYTYRARFRRGSRGSISRGGGVTRIGNTEPAAQQSQHDHQQNGTRAGLHYRCREVLARALSEKKRSAHQTIKSRQGAQQAM